MSMSKGMQGPMIVFNVGIAYQLKRCQFVQRLDFGLVFTISEHCCDCDCRTPERTVAA